MTATQKRVVVIDGHLCVSVGMDAFDCEADAEGEAMRRNRPRRTSVRNKRGMRMQHWTCQVWSREAAHAKRERMGVA